MSLTNYILLIIMYIIETIKYALGQYIFFKERPRKIYAMVCGLIVFSILDLSGLITVYTIRIIMYLIVYMVMYINISGNFTRKLSVVLLMVCMIGGFDELIGIILKVFISDAVYSYQIRSLIQSGFSLAVLIFSYIFIPKKINHERVVTYIKKKIYIIFALMASFLLLTISTLSYLKGAVSNIRFGIFINILSISSFFCLGLLIILIVYIKNMNEKLEKVVDTEQDLIYMQKKYYDTLLEKEKDTRRYRHDMNNHLLCLKELAYNGNEKFVLDYIDNLQDELIHISEKTYTTGNELLDIIFNYYLKPLENVDVRVNGMCKRIPQISNVDLCIIFSNLIQNAVEAVVKQEENGKFIDIKIEQGKEYIKFSIKNSTAINRLLDSEKRAGTTKRDKENHGFGLFNIISTVERNDGIFEIYNSGNTYETVLFFSNRNSSV